MEIKIIEENFDPSFFNHAAGHPLQSWQWGEARKKMGIEVLRVGEFAQEKLTNVFTITFHPIPHTPWTVGYLPRSVAPSQEALALIAQEGKRRKSIFIKIEPNSCKNISSVILRSEATKNLVSKKSFADAQDDRVVKSLHPLFPSWTQMLDLTKSEEDLMAGLKPKTRYNIRVAQKHGVKVIEATTSEGFEMFAQLYFATTQRQEYRGHNKAYHQTFFETLKENIAHILVATYKDKPLAVYELFLFNGVLYYPYGGSSLEYKEVMASNLLMWEAIRFGKAHGATVFDMWGSLPPDYASAVLSTSDRSAPWSGFTRFKEGYGTEFVEFIGSYDLILNKPLYALYNLADRIRKIFL